MGAVLNADQRRHLDGVVQRARAAAEQAATDALRALAVAEPTRPTYLTDADNSLRLALREKARQLGDSTARSGADLTNLVREVAYEQWHRLLFARFLEVNGLLRHPEFRDTSLTLDDCADLADDLGEPDGWSVAARFASEILPGVFRLDDPAVQVHFAAEQRLELEKILLSLPAEVFVTEDALGWVYQFWQTAEKKRVNESGVKIGGTDISPVTQLFTENYMVRFLLENSLGAWWANRYPNSPLINTFEYLRFGDDGKPAAGSFGGWPSVVADVTVMDPCCGSGHFLVQAFGMLWRMRVEEEGLSPVAAQDAVLRDNLFGLELDARCVQIAMFAVALEAWKAGGGWRELSLPNIACSGIPVKAPIEQWKSLAGADFRLESALVRLHSLFRDADTLGSLVDPVQSVDLAGLTQSQQALDSIDWVEIEPVLAAALHAEPRDPTGAVLSANAAAVARASEYLAQRYVLVVTNVPYLSRGKQSEMLRKFLETYHPLASGDLATSMLERMLRMATSTGTVAVVTPDKLLYLDAYKRLRKDLLARSTWQACALLGVRGFSTPMFDLGVVLLMLGNSVPCQEHRIASVDVSLELGPAGKAHGLREAEVGAYAQVDQLSNPDHRVLLSGVLTAGNLLGDYAQSFAGLQTGDDPRYQRAFWELPEVDNEWIRQLGSIDRTGPHLGRSKALHWKYGMGALSREPGAVLRGLGVWGKQGVAVRVTGNLPATLYDGTAWDQNLACIVPGQSADLAGLWAFVQSDEFRHQVRLMDKAVKVTPGTMLKVAYDRDHWSAVAKSADPLPEPRSDDPTQWVFRGRPQLSTAPLQVAVARLLGYRWPDQDPDDLDRFEDVDGIAALQTLPREADLATRLREVLAASYGKDWSGSFERTLVASAGGKSGRLEDWLRDTFFAQHVKVFNNRPFLWQIWDGRKDGFSAVVNYHRLDHKTLEKLTFTSLGAWIERQKHEAAAGRAGADARLAAADALQEKLKLILDGGPPYDVFVRWRELHEQPIGWNPDLDDGVRLNIRPFVTAGVLRSKVNVQWKKDRGTNADGSERLNDLHPTVEERRAARQGAGVNE